MPSPNVHLEHIEDEIFNSGIEGGRASINFIRSLRDMLMSGSKRSVNVTVKWDGAPAIFCGNDPETGKFFVAKKSLFNKTPKFYTSIAEIDADLDGQLADKFKACYNNLKDIGIKDILQGDLMFTKGDLAKQDINGESYETFQPNTIMYAVPSTSKLASTMRAAQVGIVFHTTYTGDSLMNLKATFGANISSLKKTSKVWMDDAEYNDVSGTATFTQKDSAEITRLMSRTGKVFQKIKAPQLKKFLDMQNKIDAGLTYKTYHNSKVREGTNFLRLNYKKHADEYLKFVEDKMDTQIGKLKSDSAKKTKEKNKNIILTEVRKNLLLLKTLVEFQALINYAKIKILTKVNKASQMTAMFVKKGNGFDVVAPEGFVAIDNNLGGAVKLVDRMEFSLNNFTVQKDWDK
tara:strand:+ start:16440 stop:17651 length:1212 start_codon:yes stop_codon:yes gene_type:complete